MEAITDTTNVMDEANMADYGSKHAMVYLASPYSDADEGVRIERAQAAAEVMAKLLDKGINVYSPIVCIGGLAKYRKGQPTEYEAWDSICEAMIERCDSLMVLTLDGWQKSKGIRAEMEFAREIGMPIRGVNIHGSPVKIDW